MTLFVRRLLSAEQPNPFLDNLGAFAGRVAVLGMANGLAQAVL